MVAHWKYRQSKYFNVNGFKMPGYKWSNPLTIALFVGIFISLFFNQASIFAAVGALIWLVGFNLILTLKDRRKATETSFENS